MKYFFKSLQKKQHACAVIFLLLFALSIRVLLAAASWPLLNSDEATIGIMALHIQHGEHPVFFYGQYYMGALQAYLAAAFFPVFGAGLFAVRMAILLLYAGFLMAMYALTRILYTRRFALLVLFLLGLGSNAVLSRQLSAIGGYSETVFFSALSFALVAWLASTHADGSMHMRVRRIVAYSAWGLAIGLGLWSDLLILPVVVCSGALLLLFCWRELIKGYAVPVLLFLGLGVRPLVRYNLSAAPGTNSWTVLMKQQGHTVQTLATLIAQIKATVAYSIPAITGSPFCHHSEFQFLAYLGFQSSQPMDHACTVDGTLWSSVYIVLFLCATLLAVIALAVLLRQRLRRMQVPRTVVVRQTMRLGIICSTFLTIALYTHSEAPLIWPSIYSRYLICIWISTPVVLWPFWKGITSATWPGINSRVILGARTFCIAALVYLAVVMLYGTGVTLSEIPTAISADQTEHVIINTLLKDKITHIYTGYWSCDRIAFESLDRIQCGVINGDLTPGFNRYLPYYTNVHNDPHSAYFFQQQTDFLYYQPSDLKNIERKLAQTHRKYRQISIENSMVFVPVN